MIIEPKSWQNFLDSCNVLYLNSSLDYIGVYICQKSVNSVSASRMAKLGPMKICSFLKATRRTQNIVKINFSIILQVN